MLQVPEGVVLTEKITLSPQPPLINPLCNVPTADSLFPGTSRKVTRSIASPL